MRRPGLYAFLAFLTAVFGSASAAKAQTTSLLPVRVKIGIAKLQNSGTRDAVGDYLYMAEADLFIPSTSGGGRSMISAGYQERSDKGNRLRVIPLTLSKISSLTNPAAAVTGNLYYGLGAGLYLLHGTTNGSTESKTRPGGFAVAGYQFNSWFVEAKYQIVSGKAAGMSPNGVLFALGKSF